MAAMPERMGRLETRMDRVEEGISNFRAFQADACDFFSRAGIANGSLEQGTRDRGPRKIWELCLLLP